MANESTTNISAKWDEQSFGDLMLENQRLQARVKELEDGLRKCYEATVLDGQREAFVMACASEVVVGRFTALRSRLSTAEGERDAAVKRVEEVRIACERGKHRIERCIELIIGRANRDLLHGVRRCFEAALSPPGAEK